MVIERPISGFAPWDDAKPRQWSRGSVITVGLVAALHLAGAAYLYQLRATTPHADTPAEGPVIIAQPIRLTPDQPAPQRPPPPTVVRVHDAAPTPLKAPVTLPVPPQPLQAEVAASPPLLADQTLTAPDVGTFQPVQPKTKLIANPTWLARPSAEQLAQFYPPRALDDGTDGQATLDCRVTAQGALTRCTISAETPKGAGFGEAALRASHIFRMSPRTEDGQPVEGGVVHIPIRFQTAG